LTTRRSWKTSGGRDFLPSLLFVCKTCNPRRTRRLGLWAICFFGTSSRWGRDFPAFALRLLPKLGTWGTKRLGMPLWGVVGRSGGLSRIWWAVVHLWTHGGVESLTLPEILFVVQLCWNCVGICDCDLSLAMVWRICIIIVNEREKEVPQPKGA